MENIHFIITETYGHYRVFTLHPDFAEKAAWNKLNILAEQLGSVIMDITNRMWAMGYTCDFQVVLNG